MIDPDTYINENYSSLYNRNVGIICSISKEIKGNNA